jgi:hypothetical protein
MNQKLKWLLRKLLKKRILSSHRERLIFLLGNCLAKLKKYRYKKKILDKCIKQNRRLKKPRLKRNFVYKKSLFFKHNKRKNKGLFYNLIINENKKKRQKQVKSFLKL